MQTSTEHFKFSNKHFWVIPEHFWVWAKHFQVILEHLVVVKTEHFRCKAEHCRVVSEYFCMTDENVGLIWTFFESQVSTFQSDKPEQLRMTSWQFNTEEQTWYLHANVYRKKVNIAETRKIHTLAVLFIFVLRVSFFLSNLPCHVQQSVNNPFCGNITIITKPPNHPHTAMWQQLNCNLKHNQADGLPLRKRLPSIP